MANDVYRMDLTAEEIEESLIDMASHASEAWAVGERKGVPVNNTDPTYQNNSKYWASFAASAAEGACIITDPNEDGNLVIEPPTESGAWMLKLDKLYTFIGVGFATSATTAWVLIPTPTSLSESASTVSIAFSGVYISAPSGNTHAITAITANNSGKAFNANGVSVSVTTTGLTVGEPVMLMVRDVGGYVEITANQ